MTMLDKTTYLFTYPDGDTVEVDTHTKFGAYLKATREKGPVTASVDVHHVSETFTGGDTDP